MSGSPHPTTHRIVSERRRANSESGLSLAQARAALLLMLGSALQALELELAVQACQLGISECTCLDRLLTGLVNSREDGSESEAEVVLYRCSA